MHTFDNLFYLKQCYTFFLEYACRYVPWFCGWCFRWAPVDDKPKILLDTLHATNRDLYPLYTVSSVSYWHYSVPSATSKIFKWKETREILLKVAYGRKTTVQIIHRHVQTDLDMIADDFVSRRNQRLEFSSTYANAKLWIIHDE
jgi:hypothetical protein